jgi:hypothetical protein
VGTDHVNLKVAFQSSVETRTFLGVPVRLDGVPNTRNWVVSPPTASVTVEHSAVLGTALDPEIPPVELYVDATNVVASQMTLPILVRNAGDGINIIRMEPQQVTITFTAP